MLLHLTARPPPVVPIDSGGHRERVVARRDSLVEANLRLVPPIAHRISLGLPPSFDIEDLIAVGNLGLLHAATRYRPKQHGGTPFAAFARPRIRGAMLDSIRRKNWEESTRPPIHFQWEERQTSEGGSSGARAAQHEPFVEATIEIDVDAKLLRKRIALAIARLPARQQAVLSRYYADELPNLATVGAALGLSEWRVIREHADAIAELRRRLRAA